MYVQMSCMKFLRKSSVFRAKLWFGNMIEWGIFTWVIGLIGTKYNMLFKMNWVKKINGIPIWSICKLKLSIFYICCHGVKQYEVGVER